MPFTPEDVRRYYDRNTDAFVRHGQGGSIGAIHRAVWGPGVPDRAHAFRYVEDRVAAAIDSLALDRPARVLDLGCGVGASLLYLASRRPLRGTGITISGLQARLGQQRAAALGLADRVTILEGDYCALPPGVEAIDVAYAIESFVHGPSPARFFAEAARVLRPGGLLLVCDDVRRDAADAAAAANTNAAAAAAADRTIAQFMRGWHVNSLLTTSELRAAAAAAGFTLESTTDLTPYLELNRPRDRAIAIVTAIAQRLGSAAPNLPYLARLAPLIGGAALQRGLSRGWLAYELNVFRLRAPGP